MEAGAPDTVTISHCCIPFVVFFRNESPQTTQTCFCISQLHQNNSRQQLHHTLPIRIHFSLSRSEFQPVLPLQEMKVNTSDVVQDNATSLISPSPDDFWVTLLREWVSRTNGTLEGKSLNVAVLEAPYTPKMLVYVCCILLVPAGVTGNAMLLRMSLQPDLRSHSYR